MFEKFCSLFVYSNNDIKNEYKEKLRELDIIFNRRIIILISATEHHRFNDLQIEKEIMDYLLELGDIAYKISIYCLTDGIVLDLDSFIKLTKDKINLIKHNETNSFIIHELFHILTILQTYNSIQYKFEKKRN